MLNSLLYYFDVNNINSFFQSNFCILLRVLKQVNLNVCIFFYSGQVHIISTDNEDNDDNFVAAASPPKIDLRPNTQELDVC